jgi:polysaccharide export outer membrane protein
VRKNFLLFYLTITLISCASYRQNIMFRGNEQGQPEAYKNDAASIEKNYLIQGNDLLQLDVFSNKGERIIDPNPELTNQPNQNQNAPAVFNYLVESNGIVKLPMIGELQLKGLSIRQAEEIAQKEYANYFKEPFVRLSFANKRVIVLGAPGGQVIPLTNQNVTVVEVLALAKGINNEAKADQIKLIRGEHVYQLDFSTIKGFKDGNMVVEPGDVIYVEPIRRPFTEALRDNFTVISLIVSLSTLVVVIRSVN